MRCGVGDYTSRLSEHLAALAVKVHVLTSRGARADFRIGGGAVVDVIPVIDQWDCGALIKIGETVADIKPDLVLLQWPTAVYGRFMAVNRITLFLKKTFPDLPVITTLHEYRYFNWFGQWRARRLISGADRTILVDPQDLALLRKKSGQGNEDLQHIPIGSNIPRQAGTFDRAAKRKQLGFEAGHFVVVFFGFVNEPKGVETLLHAVSQLSGNHCGLRLLFLAQLDEKNTYHRKISALMRQLDLDKIMVRPKWEAPREVAGMLAAADCAVLPYTDGISMKRGTLLACLEQSLSIISTLPEAAGQVPFIDGQNMLLVPAKNISTLKAALEKYLQNPEVLAAFSKAAGDLREAFSWERIAEQHLALFEDVIEEYC